MDHLWDDLRVFPGELDGVRDRLEEFAGEVFTSFVRNNGGLYLRGLMLDGQRKSMQPMAERLGVDHQRLQQFITSSTWDYARVRRRLAGRAMAMVEPQAWVLDDTGHLKDREASPGVARQYTGTAGKVTNCQIAVSVHAVTLNTARVGPDRRRRQPAAGDLAPGNPENPGKSDGQEALAVSGPARATGQP